MRRAFLELDNAACESAVLGWLCAKQHADTVGLGQRPPDLAFTAWPNCTEHLSYPKLTKTNPVADTSVASHCSTLLEPGPTPVIYGILYPMVGVIARCRETMWLITWIALYVLQGNEVGRQL